MDRTDWPWSWEEEIKWKADLEERDFEFFQELIDNAVEDGTADLRYNVRLVAEDSSEDAVSSEYFVTV